MTRRFFIGNGVLPDFQVTGPPVTARQEFLDTLQGVGSEGFEGFSVGTADFLTLTFPGSEGDITATLSPFEDGLSPRIAVRAWIPENPNGLQGRFNTTPDGAHVLVVQGSFQIVFSSPISAFGFYGTDIGDFSATLDVELYGTDGVVDAITLVDAESPSDNGQLLFWGFVDDARTYSRIVFRATQRGDGSPFDVFGFDDMVIGDPAQAGVTPPSPVLHVSRGWGATANVVTIRIR